MIRYALIAATGATVALGAWVWVLTERNGALRADIEVAAAGLRACDARVSSILKDKERDDEIDALSDDDLRDLFFRWMPDGATD